VSIVTSYDADPDARHISKLARGLDTSHEPRVWKAMIAVVIGIPRSTKKVEDRCARQ